MYGGSIVRRNGQFNHNDSAGLRPITFGTIGLRILHFRNGRRVIATSAKAWLRGAPLLCTLAFIAASAQAEDAPVSFNRDIRQILSNNCFKCHGPDEEIRDTLPRLDLFVTATTPNDDGVAPFTPGNPDASEAYQRIVSDNPNEVMPPPDSGKTLNEAEKDLIRRWIEQGAQYETHWSYSAPIRPAIPTVKNTQWPRSDLDRIVLSRLEQEGLTPSPQAEPATLFRRVHLDLIGLPPTPEATAEFIENPTAENFEQTVDALLASPAYGEHWARVWLDLARYADSKGYEADRARTMWPYRDWVIRAFNDDMPYDQFTREQLAGDLLDNPTRDQLIATAFHRNTPTNDEGGTDDEEFRVAAVVDRVNTTMQVWMGTTMACVQCHTHKYDPISHREYYQFFALLNQTKDADTYPIESPVLPLYEPGQADKLAYFEEKLKEAQEAFDTAKTALESAPEEAKAEHEAALELAEKRKKSAEDILNKFKESIPNLPILEDLPQDEHRTTRRMVRGSFLNLAEEVEPGTPAAFPPIPKDAPMNRLGLAEWLMADENPLTARVAVNRHWERFFGIGIVETAEEFGTQGELPSNQDLLDWLAVEFRESGWSFKKLCKTIVMSATYQQDSTVTPDLWERDQYNRLLARGPRFRLTAEMIRDQALAIGGLLSDAMYGPPVMPYQPDGIWQVVYNGDPWKLSDGDDRYRRGLYTFWRRSSPYPSMMTFDATSREVCVSRRLRTNTPLQALVTLNDPVYVEAAQGLARRMYEADDRHARHAIAYGFYRATARDPRREELSTLVDLFDRNFTRLQDDLDAATKLASDPLPLEGEDVDVPRLAALTVVGNVLLNMDEVLTKE